MISGLGPPKVDIALFGDKELQRKLNRLASNEAKKVVRAALRKGSRRVKDRVIQNLSGNKVNVRTGELINAFRNAKIRSEGNPRLIRIGVVLPSREELGIDSEAKYFYPFAIEYGHKRAPAHPYMRPAIDEHKDAEIAAIGRDIGKGIEKVARK